MRRTIGVFAVLSLVGTIPVAGQAQWDETRLDSGTYEYRLYNDDGVSIVLGCRVDGVYAGFEFPMALEDTERAMARGIPGARRNLSLTRVNERGFRVTGLVGLGDLLGLLSSSPHLVVRLAGHTANFEIFGSQPIVMSCLRRQEAVPGGGQNAQRFWENAVLGTRRPRDRQNPEPPPPPDPDPAPAPAPDPEI